MTLRAPRRSACPARPAARAAGPGRRSPAIASGSRLETRSVSDRRGPEQGGDVGRRHRRPARGCPARAASAGRPGARPATPARVGLAAPRAPASWRWSGRPAPVAHDVERDEPDPIADRLVRARARSRSRGASCRCRPGPVSVTRRSRPSSSRDLRDLAARPTKRVSGSGRFVWAPTTLGAQRRELRSPGPARPPGTAARAPAGRAGRECRGRGMTGPRRASPRSGARAASDTRIWPPWPAPMIRAVRCTSMPV